MLLIKAAEDAKNAHTYAIEWKTIMEQHKKKRTKNKQIRRHKVFTRKVQVAVVNIFLLRYAVLFVNLVHFTF